MIVKYLFSSSNGDIPLGLDNLLTPFKITPEENHPFLTLEDYFEALKAFVLKDDGKSIALILGEGICEDRDPKEIEQVVIRSEKHGALYHLASVEIFTEGQGKKFAVSTAISQEGKRWLSREYAILRTLEERFNLPYLPKVFLKGEIKCNSGNGNETFSMFLAEWFGDYHEWHISLDEKGKNQRICIWDQERGNRFVSKEEGFEIYRQASKILTLYYDTGDFRQIYPWHHAAGDFVVKTGKGVIEVKLTTARKYDPLMIFREQENINPFVAIIYFFLNMTIRMRLDKADGIGKVVWADDYSLEAVTKGFFETLRFRKTKGWYDLGKVEDLFALLRSFRMEELESLSRSLLDLYRQEDSGDLSLIKTNLRTHVKELHQVLQNFRL